MIKQKQTLRQRIGTGIVWLGGLASLAGLSGCESYNEYDALSLASTSAVNESQTPQQAMFFGLMSDHFKEQGNRYDRRVVVGQNQNDQWAYIEKDGRITERMNLSTGQRQRYETLVLHYPEGPRFISGWIIGENKEGYLIETQTGNDTSYQQISKDNFVGFAAK